MESLTKENFWNAIQEQYPVEMKMFCDWIDEYKKRVQWNMLFKHLPGYSGGAVGFKYPKYHDLPLAMQIGIFIQFTVESSKANFFDPSMQIPFTMDDWKECVRRWFTKIPGE